MEVEVIHEAKATLGEGPAWDAKNQTLYWVDILERRIHYHQGGYNGVIQLDAMPGCLAPCKDGTLIVAARASIFQLDPSSGKQTILTSITEPTTNRFNDGKCGPDGRFLAGTMDMNEKVASGALYSFDGKIITRLLDGVRISNGLAWSPDYRVFYYIDTPTREVRAFDYDLESGDIANMRVAITVPEELGWPDGMASDTRGDLWIGMWGGACVTRWNPDTGELLDQIPVPARNVTCAVFGGANMDELYITSARKGSEDAGSTGYLYDGSLFKARTQVSGMATFEFG